MGKRSDVVIFGATGFTGERVAKYFAKAQLEGKTTYKWAIAGRNTAKLAAILQKLSQIDSRVEKEVRIVKADSADQESLNQMAAETRLVLNCVGPYRFSGEAVVKACIENGCDYLDVAGEPEFFERMFLQYHKEAVEKKRMIVSGCGFDSVPADMGVLFTTRQFGPKGVAAGIEGFITIHGAPGYKGNYATWESAVHGISSHKSLQKVRSQISKDSELSPSVPRVSGYRLNVKKLPFYEPRLKRWCVLFPGADSTMVRATQRTVAGRYKDPQPTFAAYFSVSSWFYLAILGVVGVVFNILSRWKLGRWLLLTFPRLFSCGAFAHGGPPQSALEKSWVEYDFFGEGYADAEAERGPRAKPNFFVHTRLVGPEAGYVWTPVCLVQAAFTLLEERKTGGIEQEGGVLTPGAAFAKSRLQQRLEDTGCTKFLVVKTHVVS